MFSNDYPGLVAPRPVRYTQQHNAFITRSASARLLSAAVDQFDRVKIADDNPNNDYRTSPIEPVERDLASPRSASRASLPSETLEEFLSILRPSFFPPTSPNSMRNRRQGAAGSLPNYTHERSYSCKARRLELTHQKSDSNLYALDELERDRSMQLSRSSNMSGGGEELDVYPTDNFTPRWHNSSTLSSPVSRMHTRNPFQRHPSYDYEVSFSGDQNTLRISPALFESPIASYGVSISPSAIPLPSPSPEELMLVM